MLLNSRSKLSVLLMASATALVWTAQATAQAGAQAPLPWMSPEIVARQISASSDTEREVIANQRAKLLLGAMTLPQKMQQLTGSAPEILLELPNCFGARHVSGIAELRIPTFRISNGPVGVGQNDCVARSLYDEAKKSSSPQALYVAYTHPSSAKATALPSAMGVAASFDPKVAVRFGEVIAREMNNLGLHVFEAPGVNLARLPILGRNFEYFGEDPYLSGVMAVAETKAVQGKGLIAMLKHYVANEQETNRQTIQETVDRQTLRELYLLPFEMAIKDGKAGAVMCAYNYVNGVSSCESRELLTDVLRKDWGFTGYVQSDFFAMKSTVATLKAGMDHEMPLPQHWSPAKLAAAIERGELSVSDIDTALERRYTQTFKAGIFDRTLVQTPIDFAAGGQKARDIGVQSAVLLQNNGALPLRHDFGTILLIGKASQIYAQQAVAGGSMVGQPMGAGGGSSDVVPQYTVTPIKGIRNSLKAVGNAEGIVKLVLVDDTNETATIDGKQVPFSQVLEDARAADAVIMMAGTISEEGADRATFAGASGTKLAGSAALGSSLDWYADQPKSIVVAGAKDNVPKNSNTNAMIRAIMNAGSASSAPMSAKTVLVLKDNAGISIEPWFVGSNGPAILEAWFPGQEDGNIVADLLFGIRNPSGKLPVTMPLAGKGFLDAINPSQFPGVPGPDGKTQTVSYGEQLHIGYRWYDANVGGKCAARKGRNPCVAFPFGHGLSYTQFAFGKPKVAKIPGADKYRISVSVTNIGKRGGAEVVQAYVGLPASASRLGAPQPPKRLIGFQKVDLARGEKREVTLELDPSASHHPLSVWDAAQGHWIISAGSFRIWIGKSSAPSDLVNAGTIVR